VNLISDVDVIGFLGYNFAIIIFPKEDLWLHESVRKYADCICFHASDSRAILASNLE
jgi:hypothetical protein